MMSMPRYTKIAMPVNSVMTTVAMRTQVTSTPM
jgi:hypothetical protein